MRCRKAHDPLDRGHNLNIHKMLRRCPGFLLNGLCTSNSHPVTGTSCRVNCLVCLLQCYTSKNNRDHQFTVFCYVSNIVRAFTLRYLYEVRVFRVQVLDIIRTSMVLDMTGNSMVACSIFKKHQSYTNFGGRFKCLNATMMQIPQFTKAVLQRTSQNWFGKSGYLPDDHPHLCRMIGLISATIF